MPNSEDQDTPVDENEQERYGSEATSPRKRNGSSAQGGDGPNSKRRTISGVYHHIWQATTIYGKLPPYMASYASDNSEIYIPEKDPKKAILIKTARPVNLDPVKKLDDYL